MIFRSYQQPHERVSEDVGEGNAVTASKKISGWWSWESMPSYSFKNCFETLQFLEKSSKLYLYFVVAF